jgi:hypothetical protein
MPPGRKSSGGLKGPLLPQSQLAKVGGEPPTFSNGFCGGRGNLKVLEPENLPETLFSTFKHTSTHASSKPRSAQSTVLAVHIDPTFSWGPSGSLAGSTGAGNENRGTFLRDHQGAACITRANLLSQIGAPHKYFPMAPSEALSHLGAPHKYSLTAPS